jgi:hypothetical protein
VEKLVEKSAIQEIKLTKINGYSSLHRNRTPALLLKSCGETAQKPAIFRGIGYA